MMFAALAFVVLATPLVDQLSVVVFWLLPYLILNIPAGSITLKVPEATTYLFAVAAMARAGLGRQRVVMPPATPQVLVYLAVVAVSAALAPAVPVSMVQFGGLQGPEWRPAAMVFWLSLSWVVVISIYHVVGTSPTLYRRCVCAHILSGGIASLIGIVGYVITLHGYKGTLQAYGNGHSFIYTGGSFYRLTGVSYEPLLMAYYLCSVMPVSLAVALFRRDWMPRWVALLAFAMQGLALLMTFSAGGWAALLLGLFIMGVLFRPQRINWRAAMPGLIALVSALAIGVLVYISNAVIFRTMNDAVRKITNGGYKMRDDENLTGVRIFQDHFWLGAGPGMTPFHFLHYHPVAFTIDQASSIFVNNLYINTLAETGIIGLTALLACGIAGAAILAGVIRRYGATQVPVLTALCVSLVGCAVQYWETQNLFLIYFPVLIGLACAGARLAPTRVEEGISHVQETR
jgi:hypothetical protein